MAFEMKTQWVNQNSKQESEMSEDKYNQIPHIVKVWEHQNQHEQC